MTATAFDIGIEAVRKAIDARSAPYPAADGAPDPRTPANRRARALVQAMLGYLAAETDPPAAANAQPVAGTRALSAQLQKLQDVQ